MDKNNIRFEITAIDSVRTRAIKYALCFGCVLLVGLVVIKSLVNILIGA
jgi:hypothetical protein